MEYVIQLLNDAGSHCNILSKLIQLVLNLFYERYKSERSEMNWNLAASLVLLGTPIRYNERFVNNQFNTSLEDLVGIGLISSPLQMVDSIVPVMPPMALLSWSQVYATKEKNSSIAKAINWAVSDPFAQGVQNGPVFEDIIFRRYLLMKVVYNEIYEFRNLIGNVDWKSATIDQMYPNVWKSNDQFNGKLSKWKYALFDWTKLKYDIINENLKFIDPKSFDLKNMEEGVIYAPIAKNEAGVDYYEFKKPLRGGDGMVLVTEITYSDNTSGTTLSVALKVTEKREKTLKKLKKKGFKEENIVFVGIFLRNKPATDVTNETLPPNCWIYERGTLTTLFGPTFTSILKINEIMSFGNRNK